MKTVDDFFSSTEITGGALTPEQAAQVLDLMQEGETAPSADLAGAPAPAPAADQVAEQTTTDEAPEPKPEPEPDPEPAILAKDGKHLIPFDKLAEARESAQRAAAERDEALRRAAELEAKLEAAKQPPKEEKPEESVDLKALRRDRYNAMLDGDLEKALELDEKIDAEVERRRVAADSEKSAQERAAREAAEQQAALDRVAKEAWAKYPALDHTSDQANADAIDFVKLKRDQLIVGGEPPDKALSKAVESAAKLFKWSGQPSTATPPDVKAAAAAAIAAAKAPVPMSLSAIPGGKPSGLSTLEQLAGSQNGPEMLEVMADMTPEQIEAFLNRSL